MKKNILTIVIMASTVLNLILTMIMVFAIVPAMNKTNKLIDRVAAVVDLEVGPEEEQEDSIPIDDLEPFNIVFESKQTINLKKDEGDSESHFVIIEGITISFNKGSDDYEDISEAVEEKNVYITDLVKEAIAEETITTLDETKVKENALKKIQEFYGSKCIVRISFSGYMFQ